MVKCKQSNLIDLVSEYDNEEFIKSITLNNVSSTKELKLLFYKLDRANKVVTSYYKTLYNDYITTINSENQSNSCVDIDTIKHYKNLASKIQKAHSYVTYLITFDNPFKPVKNHK